MIYSNCIVYQADHKYIDNRIFSNTVFRKVTHMEMETCK